MIFQSVEYLCFLLFVVLVYWNLSGWPRMAFLAGISLFFYGYVHFWFVYLLLASTIVDFYCSLAIERYPYRKKIILLASVFFNLGVLAIFKYFNFFMSTIHALLLMLNVEVAPITLQLILPVGISFYTFQTMSYTIDVYRNTRKACRNFLNFLVFTSFFAPLVAGPITRSTHLLPQIEHPAEFCWHRFQSGLFLIIWGFFKKLVIADNVGLIANKVFLLNDVTFFLLWSGVFAFSIQIFADFSGYIDIAIGSALLLGYRLPINFKHPYLASSPADFWARWHISLSEWIRDYIYIPLGGSRQGILRSIWVLILTFLLCGLWHGASWNYILWGGYHGVLLLLYRYLKWLWPSQLPLQGILRIVAVLIMFGFTNVGWLIFRETNIVNLMRDLTLSPWDPEAWHDMDVAVFLFFEVFLYSLPIWAHAFFVHLRQRGIVPSLPEALWHYTAIASILFLGILLMRSGFSPDFIYFQF